MKRARASAWRTIAAVAALFVACDGGGPTEPPPPPNRAPLATGTILSVTVTAGETTTVDVGSAFRDPDGNPLAYTASTSDPGVAGVSVSGSTVTVAGVSPGQGHITVTARDPAGASAQQSFTVTVERPNRAPEATTPLGSVTLTRGETRTISLAEHFRDPDGDALAYEARSSGSATVAVTVSGSTLTLTGTAEGTATITVGATDAGGLWTEQRFTCDRRRAHPCRLDRGDARLGHACLVGGDGLVHGIDPGPARCALPGDGGVVEQRSRGVHGGYDGHGHCGGERVGDVAGLVRATAGHGIGGGRSGCGVAGSGVRGGSAGVGGRGVGRSRGGARGRRGWLAGARCTSRLHSPAGPRNSESESSRDGRAGRGAHVLDARAGGRPADADRDRGRCLAPDPGDGEQQPGPRRAGGALSCHRRSQLDEPGPLADGRAARSVVRSHRGIRPRASCGSICVATISVAGFHRNSAVSEASERWP